MYRVMVVDDEFLMREALKKMIERVEGFTVCCCGETGKEAVEACRSQAVDLVFMDVIMPEMNGIEAGYRIREINNAVTIVMLSAYNDFDYAKEALRIRAMDYLLKPLSFKTVNGILDEFAGINTRRRGIYNAICESIDVKDYGSMYHQLSHFVQDIINQSQKNDQEVVEVYYQMEQKLVEHYNTEESYQYVEKPKGMLPPIEYWLEFRLYAIMDLVFRHNALVEYPILEDVFIYIDHHLEDAIGLREIIENCRVSQGYLSRIFKRTFNISVMEYLHLCKMMQAKWLFCTQNLNVIDVAFGLGYNESSYFSKLFKKYEHTTISQYKKKLMRIRGESDGGLQEDG